MKAEDMTPQEKEAAARALYERNVLVGPSWDQLGKITQSVWIEDVERGRHLHPTTRVPAATPAPSPAPAASALSDFVRNATPERKEEVYGRVMDKVAEQQQEVIERAKSYDPGSQGALF